MAVSRKAMTEGIRTPIFLCALIDAVLQSLRQKSKIFASSLYTREPLGAPAPVHLSMFLRKIRELCHIHTTSQRHGLLTVTASLAGGCSFWSTNQKTGLPHIFAVVPVSWEALIKSARAGSERFCSQARFKKRRNTVCISRFLNRRLGAKDPLPSRRRFIQSFP